MKPNLNLRQTWLLLVFGIALGFSGVLVARQFGGPWYGVRVVRLFPREGAPVAATTRIGVEFSAPMQPQSVESRFQLTPSVEGVFEWKGSILWYRPTLPLQPGTTYETRLDPGAVSARGRALKQARTWRFTVRSPQIVYLALIEGEGELWRIPINQPGANSERITSSGDGIADYAVSPDGSRIAFIRSN